MSTSLLPVGQFSPGNDLGGYIQAVNGIAVLSVEEERELAFRLYDEGDLEAARRLVLSHLRFVVHIARSYSGYGLPQADLIQEGNVGLMKAVKRFDPNQGVRLVSFAVHWIKAEIHEFVLRNWRIVKIATTKAQRKLFFNLRSAKKRLAWLNNDEVDAIAKDLDVKPEVVRDMEGRLSAFDAGTTHRPVTTKRVRIKRQRTSSMTLPLTRRHSSKTATSRKTPRAVFNWHSKRWTSARGTFCSAAGSPMTKPRCTIWPMCTALALSAFASSKRTP